MKKLALKKYRDWFLDLLFPKFCIGCGKEGTWLCSKCERQVLLVSAQICPRCEKLNALGKYHHQCREKIALKGIIVAAYFQEGPLKELIHNFKYNSVVELKGYFGKMLADSVPDVGADLITFVPLHPRRLAKRGYNQAKILALEASRWLKIPCTDTLRKITHTKRQVGLIGAQRRRNLSGVFKTKSGQNIQGKKIIIIDDITTTGSTLNECAKVLKAAGAKEAWGLVIARG